MSLNDSPKVRVRDPRTFGYRWPPPRKTRLRCEAERRLGPLHRVFGSSAVLWPRNYANSPIFPLTHAEGATAIATIAYTWKRAGIVWLQQVIPFPGITADKYKRKRSGTLNAVSENMIIEIALGLCFGVLLAVRLVSLVIRANKEGKPYHTNVDSDTPPQKPQAAASSPVGAAVPLSALTARRTNIG